ncbi:MAG: hypothetical protein AAF628_20300 [Planctomycetota bacterium]
MTPFRLFVAAVVAAPTLVAQTTWIVDAAAGPGAAFTDLPPAFAVALADDTVLVRSGTYSGGETRAGIRLQFEPGADLGMAQTISVRDLRAGERFLFVGGRRSSLADTQPVFIAEQCEGQVVVDRLVTAAVAIFFQSPQVRVRNCAEVAFTGCDVGGSRPLEVERSQVVLTDSAVRSFDINAPALVARDAQLIVGETTIRGADGTVVGYSGVGLRLERSSALVTGSGERGIAAGLSCRRFGGVICTPTQVPAAEIVQSQWVVDPRVPIGIVSGPRPVRRGIPALRANGGPLGGELSTDLWSHAGGSAWLVASVPTPLQWTPWGPLGLSANHVVLDARSVAPGERVPLILPIAPSLFPAEGALTLQAVVLDVDGQLGLSNPASVVLF